MTKIQTKQVALAECAVQMGNLTYAALSLSAEIRMARREADKTAILSAAKRIGVDTHPAFII